MYLYYVIRMKGNGTSLDISLKKDRIIVILVFTL